MVETEASREAVRKELANLQRKMGELIDESRLKEKDYQMALEDSRRSERKLADQGRNLEINLENVGAEAAELKLRLSGSEGRVNALEAQLARIEGAKQDVEFKLSSIVSSLKRTIGFRQEMPRARSPVRSRSQSPRRSRPNSPSKGIVFSDDPNKIPNPKVFSYVLPKSSKNYQLKLFLICDQNLKLHYSLNCVSCSKINGLKVPLFL